MTHPEYPGPVVLLTRLLNSGGASPIGPELLEKVRSFKAGGETPGQGFFHQLADSLGLRTPDVFLIAGVPVPEDALPLDEQVSGELPRLVRSVLELPASSRKQLCECARSLPQEPRVRPPQPSRLYEQYPPGFGGLLVQMLALRNLNWLRSAQVLSLMSGVHLSAATIGAVGRGRKELDSELLAGVAVVLGVPVSVLVSLTALPAEETGPKPSPQTVDAAELLWEVRRLTVDQVRHLREMASDMCRKTTDDKNA